mgnify:CR=1 FL=1
MGKTISLAGNPNIKAINITPSSPMRLAKGSRKFATTERIVLSPICTFAKIHISKPQGTDDTQALASTNTVRSKIERTRTLVNCGFLYGGSSRVNDDAIPLRTVMERTFDIISVIITPIIITPKRIIAESTLPAVTKNIVIIIIIVGNRPLHGTKLLVSIAISLSRGESIILQPVTPQALQPNPIAIVIACFPQAFANLKPRSRLKAIRGR